MAEYIDREAAVNSITAIMPSMSTPDGCGERDDLVLAAQEMCVDAMQEINNIPAADVAPVRHGRWKGYTKSAYRGTDDFGDPIYRDATFFCCSNCGRRTAVKERYCPNCGAKMDLEE